VRPHTWGFALLSTAIEVLLGGMRGARQALPASKAALDAAFFT
jgi:hypothetical protein